MASIKISELRPAGSELFQDSESFLNELTDREMLGIEGGFTGIAFNNGQSISVQTVNGNTANANSFGNANTAVSFGG